MPSPAAPTAPAPTPSPTATPFSIPQPVLLLGGLGCGVVLLLLLVLLIVLLLRRRPSRKPKRPTAPLPPSPADADAPTRPLPHATVAFAPLPEGALLKEGQYEVLEKRTTGPQVNEHLVEATRPVRLCPQCRAEIADLQERFCTSCGADLSEASPLFLQYRVREGAREEIFAVPLALVRASLHHPGLWLPREVFAEAPYGPPRIYLVEPEQPPTPAAALAIPQEATQVLKWGVTLAQT